MKSLLVFTVLLVLAACTANLSPAATATPGATAAPTPLSAEPPTVTPFPAQTAWPLATPTTARAAAVTPDSQRATPRTFPSGVAFTPPAPSPSPTPKPPELLLQEREALLARLEQFLSRNGYSPQLQLPDLRQSPADCGVQLDSLLNPRSAGEVPILLLALNGITPYCEGLFIFHWDGQAWQRQKFDSGEACCDPAAVAAAQQVSSGQVELGLAWDQCVHCSVSHIWYALLRLVNGQWVTLWRSTVDQFWHGAHGEFSFEDGLNRFRIRYSDWSPPDKKLRPGGTAIFSAANGGPHRYFVDTWQRSGDGYRLTGTVSLPGAYKTAVEFIYALMQGDNAGAALWTTNASLVSRARELQLDRLPAPANADDDDRLGTVTIWRNETPGETIPKMRRYVTLHMTRPHVEWLITSIERLP